MVERKISGDNLSKLESIQSVITFEEGDEISLDDALRRVLRFYKKFVPYS